MLQDYRKEKFDIIIQGGQSNSEGCGIGPVESPYQPRPEILMMENDFKISMLCEKEWENNKVGNFVQTFSEDYIKNTRLEEKRKLLVLMAAVGGTGFCDNRWGMNDDLYLKMIEMIKTAIALNPANRTVAFLWHQGETDTANPVRETHYNNLTSLAKSVRQISANEKLPFIAGDFVQHWKQKNIDVCTPIVTAVKDICKEIGNAAFVESDSLTSNDEVLGNGDDIHFSREALYELGHRYYDAYSTITGSKK